jgi:hypothetical protein
MTTIHSYTAISRRWIAATMICTAPALPLP